VLHLAKSFPLELDGQRSAGRSRCLVRATPGVKEVARASDGPIAFARFEISGGVKYGEFMGVMNRAAQLDLMSSIAPATPSCADGRQDDLGSPYAAPVVVGVLGLSSVLKDIQAEFDRAKTRPITLADGRTGIGFEVRPDFEAEYAVFVAKAAKAEWPGAQVVLIRPANDKGG